MSYRMFDYLVPNVNFFGPNAISVVGERCKLLGGKKALLVTDKGLRAIKDGAVDKTLAHLREAGIDVMVWRSFAKSIAISSLPLAAVARMTAVKASVSRQLTKAISTAMPGLKP